MRFSKMPRRRDARETTAIGGHPDESGCEDISPSGAGTTYNYATHTRKATERSGNVVLEGKTSLVAT